MLFAASLHSQDNLYWCKTVASVKMNEYEDDCSDEFDYQSDFTQFLKEARKNAFKVNPSTLTKEQKQLNWEKKDKKSWKRTLLSWLRNDSKSKSQKQPNPTPKPNRAQVSGPISRAIGVNSTGRARRAASGPLTGLFDLTGGAEGGKVPYMCLGELNKEKIQGYGPIYLVT